MKGYIICICLLSIVLCTPNVQFKSYREIDIRSRHRNNYLEKIIHTLENCYNNLQLSPALITDSVRLNFTILQDGTLTDIHIQKENDFSVYDSAIYECVKAKPFLFALPESFKGEEAKFSVNFLFQYKDNLSKEDSLLLKQCETAIEQKRYVYAEEMYLKFLEKHSDSKYTCFIMYQLSQLYTVQNKPTRLNAILENMKTLCPEKQ